jgi:hypothetical protein
MFWFRKRKEMFLGQLRKFEQDLWVGRQCCIMPPSCLGRWYGGKVEKHPYLEEEGGEIGTGRFRDDGGPCFHLSCK